jgi:cytidine deaminase
MSALSNDALIASAQALLHPHTVDGRLFGDVAVILVTEASNHYCGVCIDTGSGTRFCAEHAAIAAMVTAREYKIARIVAVWRDDEGAFMWFRHAGGAGNSSARSTRRIWTPTWY